MIFQIPLPPRWHAVGMLPPFDPDDQTQKEFFDERWLEEDIWHTESPNRQFLIEIMWTKPNSIDGEFYCRLVEDGDVIEGVKTKSTLEAGAWAGMVADQIQGLIEKAGQKPAQT